LKTRNVLVNITLGRGATVAEDQTYAYRARLLERDDDRALGLCEERAGSGIPKGFYPLSDIFDAKTREPLG
jgi:hypothetical protein